MTLQILSKDKKLVDEIAHYLLKEKLIANVIITKNKTFLELDANGEVVMSESYSLKGISKSLLFNTINEKIRLKYKENAPLIYSEPIILIDTKQTEDLIAHLQKA